MHITCSARCQTGCFRDGRRRRASTFSPSANCSMAKPSLRIGVIVGVDCGRPATLSHRRHPGQTRRQPSARHSRRHGRALRFPGRRTACHPRPTRRPKTQTRQSSGSSLDAQLPHLQNGGRLTCAASIRFPRSTGQTPSHFSTTATTSWSASAPSSSPSWVLPRFSSGAENSTNRRWMLWLLMLSAPLPYIANTAGWMTAELGRQPWLIYGVMRTAHGFSPRVAAGNAWFTLLGFMGMYTLLAHPLALPRLPRN